MFENLVKIITGEKKATSKEIKSELDSLLKAKEAAENQLSSLTEDLKIEQRSLLAGGDNHLSDLKARVARCEDEIQAMAQAEIDLEALFKEALEKEGDSRIKELESEISDLVEQREELKAQFLKDSAKLAVTFHLLTGRHPTAINDVGQPFHRSTDGDSFKAFQAEINNLMTTGVGVPITEAIRSLENEIRSISAQIS